MMPERVKKYIAILEKRAYTTGGASFLIGSAKEYSMQKTYSETKLIRTSNCDLTGHWRVSDILAMMQELAGTHAHFLGCGRDPLLEKNMVWVLTRTELEMDRYPVVAETVRVETFPMPNKRWLFPRYFLFYDEAGQVIGRAGTLWVLMDFVERKMAPPDAVLPFLPDNSDLTAPLPFPGNIPPVSGEAQVSAFVPANTDIDVNRHVNNTRYADMLCNALDLDTLIRQEFAHLLIHYQKEVLPGTALDLHLLREENRLRLTGVCGEERYFDIGAELRERTDSQ